MTRKITRCIAAPNRVAQISGFLPQQERDALFEGACLSQNEFHAPGQPGSNDHSSLHWSTNENGDRNPESALSDALGILVKRVQHQLPSLFSTLAIDPFPCPSISFSMICGRSGHYGSPHMDSTDDRIKISLLYYFHRTPKAFRGGDLEFYEGNQAAPFIQGSSPVARIEHEDNLLVAFPSRTFHGVSEIESNSNDFADGRFVVVGFL